MPDLEVYPGYPRLGGSLTFNSPGGSNVWVSATPSHLPSPLLGVERNLLFQVSSGGVVYYQGAIDLVNGSTLWFKWVNGVQVTAKMRYLLKWPNLAGQPKTSLGAEVSNDYTPNVSDLDPGLVVSRPEYTTATVKA